METNQQNDVFNLNLKTLESLHTTIEHIHNCSKTIALGCDEQGRKVYSGDVLRIKHKLVSLLLDWANVLIADENKFDELIKDYDKIILSTGKIQVRKNSESYNQSSIYNTNTIYEIEVDKQIDLIVRKICRHLQVTGIFKKKTDNPNFALNN